MIRKLTTAFVLPPEISGKLEIYKLFYWEYEYFISQRVINAGEIIRQGVRYKCISHPLNASWDYPKRVALSFRKEFRNETGIVLCAPCH